MKQVVANIEKSNKTTATCYHCGDPCFGRPVVLDKKFFCCEGCKMVYSILAENGLFTYYNLNDDAGISQKNQTRQEYSFLNEADTITQLIDFSDDDKTRVRFYLPQIHCSSCLWLLEHLHRLNEGILTARVDFLKKEVAIIFSHDIISLKQVVELLAMIGYAPIINYNDLNAPNRPVTDKSLYYKLGLAGFAFGNIMLLSFPEYLGMDASKNERLSEFFRFLNIILILPVVFYSGRDYFKSAWQGLKQKHLNIDVPVSLGIIALLLRSLFEIFTQTGAGYLDSLAGLIFFLLIGKWFQQTTYSKIAFDRDYKSYFPIAATIKKGDQEKQVTLDKLKKGDLLVIRHGELIPTDGILISKLAQIDYSFVSGEDALVDKKKGDLLYAGGRQNGGLIELSVTKNVSNSYLTQLWNDQSFSESNQAGNVSAIANKVASLFTWAILIISALTLIFWIPTDTGIAINAFTAVLIIACPCAVALSIPFTFGNVIRILARQGIYLRNIHVIESLTRINHIVFDKTGTLTNTQSSQMEYKGEALSPVEKQWIRSLANQSIHPLSRQIVSHFKNFAPLDVKDFAEFKGQGISGLVEDHFICIGSKEFLKAYIKNSNNGLDNKVILAIDKEIKGSFGSQSQYRTGLKEMIKALREWASISLLSGDNDKEKVNLIPIFGKAEKLFFNKNPKQKLEYIKQLQTNQVRVAMVGDGLNDAGALSQSSVGIVITEDTANFTPASDIVLGASNFNKLPLLFDFSKISIRLVYIAYGIALLYNIVGLSYATQGLLSPVIAAILMPLSSISIVIFGVAASSYMAHKKGF